MPILVDGFFDESGWIDVYTYSETTAEYLGHHAAYVSTGCGLPAGATLEEPPEAGDGEVVVWRDEVWAVVPDYRGPVFQTADGAEVKHTMPGELPPELTTLPRPSAAHLWAGLDWVLDAALDLQLHSQQEQTWIESELRLAGREIDKHQDAYLGTISTESAWRTYRNELRAWPANALFPTKEERPVAPSTS